MQNNKAILFDRDGVVNYRIVGDYVKSKNEFCFIPDFLKFFKFIKQNDFLAFLVTNQQGVGKGMMTEDQLIQVLDYMQTKLKETSGYSFDDIYFCTELAETNSFYRKPNPGMLLEAINNYNIEISESLMIGDSKSDVLAGRAVGMKTILLAPPYVDQSEEPYFIFKNFYEIEKSFNELFK